VSIILIGFFAGFILSLPAAFLLGKVWKMVSRRNKIAFFGYNPITAGLEITWQRLRGEHPTIKVNGRKLDGSCLPKEFRKTYDDHTAFFVDKITGECFEPYPDKEMPDIDRWPDAYDRLRAHFSVRERKVGQAAEQDDNRVNWAMYGAIAGGVAVLMLMIILVLLWNLGGF
jgi:hypothetical protein